MPPTFWEVTGRRRSGSAKVRYEDLSQPANEWYTKPMVSRKIKYKLGADLSCNSTSRHHGRPPSSTSQ